MRIAVIGAGQVGGTLGRRFAERHDVVFGVRPPASPEVLALVASAGSRARSAPVAEAMAAGEVIFLAIPWTAVEPTIAAGLGLEGKILVDCTNPVGPGLSHALPSGSASERLAAQAPGAQVVKAFSTAGYEVFADPRFGSEAASLFLCGDDTSAKEKVAGLARELGLDPVDCGPLRQARRLEELALLWISLAAQGQGRAHAFRLLRR